MTIRDATVGIKLDGLADALNGVTRFGKAVDDLKAKSPIDLKIGNAKGISGIDQVLNPIKSRLSKPFDLNVNVPTTPATKGIKDITGGLEKVNQLFGRQVINTGRINQLASAFGPLAGGIQNTVRDATGLELGLGTIGIVGASALVAVGVGILAISGYLQDSIKLAWDFNAAMGAMERQMLATPEQMKEFTSFAVKQSLATGESMTDIRQTIQSAYSAGAGQTDGKAGVVDEEELKYLTELVSDVPATIQGANQADIVNLFVTQAQIYKSSSESMKDFYKRTADQTGQLYHLYGADITTQNIALTNNAETIQALKGDLKQNNRGELVKEAGTDLAGLFGAAMKVIVKPGLSSSRRQMAAAADVEEVLKPMLTVNPGKQGDIGRMLGVSPEEAAEKQKDPLALFKEIMGKYVSVNATAKLEMRNIMGLAAEEGGAIDVLAANYEPLLANMATMNNLMETSSIIEDNHKKEVKGLTNQVGLFWNRLETLSRVVGLVFLPTLTAIVTGINSILGPVDTMIGGFTEWAEDANGLGPIIMKIAGGAVLGLLVAGLILVGGAIAAVITGLTGMSLGAIAVVAGTVALYLAIAAAAGAILALALDSETLTSIWEGLKASWASFWETDIGKELSELVSGNITISGAGTLLYDILKGVGTRLFQMSPVMQIIAELLKKIYDVLVFVMDVASGIGDWFNSLITSLESLYGYFTGQFTDQQAITYQNALNENGELIRPELIGQTPAQVKETMPTLLKAIKEVAEPVIGRTTTLGGVGTGNDNPQTNPNGWVPFGPTVPGNPIDTRPPDQIATDDERIRAAGDANTQDFYPGVASGGVVAKAGLAFVHAGEPIVPAEIASSNTLLNILGNIADRGRNSVSNNNTPINIYLTVNEASSGTDHFELLRLIETTVENAVRHSQAY